MIKQVSTSACDTIYNVDGVELKLWAIVGGTPCLDFACYTPYSKRFPEVAKYGDGQWLGNHYLCQDPKNIQGITFNDLPNGEKDVYDFIKDTLPMKELAEKRFNDLPIPTTNLGFWGIGKSIESKRIHDTSERTYVKARIDFREYFLAPVTFNSVIYGGRCDEKVKLFSGWWKLMQAIVNPLCDNGKGLWNEISEVEYFSICQMIKDRPILDK